MAAFAAPFHLMAAFAAPFHLMAAFAARAPSIQSFLVPGFKARNTNLWSLAALRPQE
jgi:hypothetical protein